MNLIPKKDTILVLSAILVVFMGIMAMTMTNQFIFKKSDSNTQKATWLETQSSSDEISSIEKDLSETDFSDIDKELIDIEKELDQIY